MNVGIVGIVLLFLGCADCPTKAESEDVVDPLPGQDEVCDPEAADACPSGLVCTDRSDKFYEVEDQVKSRLFLCAMPCVPDEVACPLPYNVMPVDGSCLGFATYCPQSGVCDPTIPYLYDNHSESWSAARHASAVRPPGPPH